MISDLNGLINKLNNSVDMLSRTGTEYAKSYRDYRIELAKELVKLREDGLPVTLATDIARGKPEVAHLKYQEIANEAIYKANQESINSIKLQIKILENAIEREWNNAK